MHDVADQLRDWSQALAESIDPVDIDTIKAPSNEPTERFGTRRWLAVAASIVLVVAGILAVARFGGDDTDGITPATNPPVQTSVVTTSTNTSDSSAPTDPETTAAPTTAATSTTSVSTSTVSLAPPNPEDRLAAWPSAPPQPIPADAIARFLPSATIEAAGTPVRAHTDGGNAAQPTFTQIFADAERDILLTLQSTPEAIESTPIEMRQPITIEGWDDAFLTEGGLRLVASDPGGFVRLMGSGIDEDRAAALVGGMQRRPAGEPGWDMPPGSGLVEINGAWNDSAGQHFVTWFDGDRVMAQMLVSPAHTDLISQALGPVFDQVEVNGATGWLNNQGGRRSVVWSPDGTTFVVLGVIDDLIDPLELARSVIQLSTAEYESRTTTEIPAGVGDGCDGSLFC